MTGIENMPLVDVIHRPPGAVQVPLHRNGTSKLRTESWAIWLLASVLYAALGYWLVTDMSVVSFGAIDRLTRAYLVWYNSPPKLAAIGFTYPPLQTIALLPFAVIRSLATSLVALPIYSGICGGLVLMTLNRALARCDLPALFRWLVIVLVGVTPFFAFYAANGQYQMLALFFLTSALVGMLCWFIFVDMRYLVLVGSAFALAVLTDYSLFFWLVLSAAMIGLVLLRHRASRNEVEASLITFLVPSFYALGVWSLFSALIVSQPFAWLNAGAGVAVNSSQASSVHATLGGLLYGTLILVWDTAPLAFVVVPALIVVAARKRNELAAWLAGFALLAILLPAAQGLVHSDASQVLLSKGLPILIVTVISGAWLYKSLSDKRSLMGVVLVAGLVLGIFTNWDALNTFPYQSGEQAFRRAITTQQSQEGTYSKGGIQEGLLSEQAMADYIDTHITTPKSIITDNTQTFAVILLTDRPELFVTSIDNGDAAWLAKVRNPGKHILYALVAQKAQDDIIRRTYPNATTGGNPRFSVIYATPRYTLLSVSAPQATLDTQTSTPPSITAPITGTSQTPTGPTVSNYGG